MAICCALGAFAHPLQADQVPDLFRRPSRLLPCLWQMMLVLQRVHRFRSGSTSKPLRWHFAWLFAAPYKSTPRKRTHCDSFGFMTSVLEPPRPLVEMPWSHGGTVRRRSERFWQCGIGLGSFYPGNRARIVSAPTVYPEPPCAMSTQFTLKANNNNNTG